MSCSGISSLRQQRFVSQAPYTVQQLAVVAHRQALSKSRMADSFQRASNESVTDFTNRNITQNQAKMAGLRDFCSDYEGNVNDS